MARWFFLRWYWILFFLAVVTARIAADKPPKQKRPTEYDLMIDEQTDRFLGFKHQLTYFLITAATVPIGFTFSVINKPEMKLGLSWMWAAMVVGILSGLLAVGSALVALQNEVFSHREHIKSRYAGKSYGDLAEAEQKEWAKFNKRARHFSEWSVYFLVGEIVLLSVSLGWLLTLGQAGKRVGGYI